MSNRGNLDDSLMGLVKRWLKTQLRFTGNPQQGYRDRQEADRLEYEIQRRASDTATRTVVGALTPPSWKRKFSELEQRSQDQQRARERQQRAEHEARPRATVRWTFSGDVQGELGGEIPITVNRPEEPGEPLTIELEPLDPMPVGTKVFLGLRLAIPAYHGPGEYDLTLLARQAGDDWDPSVIELWLDNTDEGYYWTPEYGPARISVGPDERDVRLLLTMEDPGSTHVQLDGTITLPG